MQQSQLLTVRVSLVMEIGVYVLVYVRLFPTNSQAGISFPEWHTVTGNTI